MDLSVLLFWLKKLLAERDLDIEILKEINERKW